VRPVHALIDADLWCYDIAFAAESAEEGDLGSSFCGMMVEKRLTDILETLKIKTFEMYLTGSGNFRHDVATIKPYKGNRKQPRPKYYQYIRDYLERNHRAHIIEGMEADDYLAIRQTELKDASVIVSRDKDLRQVKGWHYGYKSGRQEEFPLTYYTEHGEIELTGARNNKLKGGGDMFLYAQCLMGDTTDNIQGIPRCGDVKAYKVLHECKNRQELIQKTKQCYVEYYEEEDVAQDMFEENMNLVFMVRELNSDGSVIKWSDYTR